MNTIEIVLTVLSVSLDGISAAICFCNRHGIRFRPFLYWAHIHPRFHRPDWGQEWETWPPTNMVRYCKVDGCGKVSRRWLRASSDNHSPQDGA